MGCLKFFCFVDSFKRIFTSKQSNHNLDDILDTLDNVIIDDDDHSINTRVRLIDPDECMVCLEALNNQSCVRIKCCKCILHRECFKKWCVMNKGIHCPICHDCLQLKS